MKSSRFALPILLFGVLLECQNGTETDNPVVADGAGDVGGNYTSPTDFAPPPGEAPPCSPLSDGQGAPRGLPRSLLLQLPEQRQLLAQIGSRGLEVWDVTDPMNATLSSTSAVQRAYELLPAGATSFWAAALESPVLEQSRVPSGEQLEPALHLIQFDVSDPAAPVRHSQATLSGDFWQMQQRGGDLWVLTARRSAADRACDAPKNQCRGPSHEAFEIHGFRPNGDTLEPIGDAELPYGVRVWWGTDGIVTLTDDATLHIVRWGADGALVGPLVLPASEAAPDPEAPLANGPADVVGNELLWVGQKTLYRFDLGSGSTEPTAAIGLGTSRLPTGPLSLFWGGKLWLSVGEQGEVWDFDAAPPTLVSLPHAFSWVLPLPDATLDGYPGIPLALGQTGSEQESFEVLTLEGSSLSVVGDALSLNGVIVAPAGVHGVGNAPAWKIVMRGAGLPLGIDPSVPPDPARPIMRAYAGIRSETGELRAEAAVVDVDSFQDAGPRPNPRLEIHTAEGTTSFELLPAYEQLLPVPNGVVVAATSFACPDFDCTSFVPGVMVFDVSATPRLVGALPMSEPDGPANNWTAYPLGTPADGSSNPEAPLAFVANIDRTCLSRDECDSLGIPAVQLRPDTGPYVSGTAPTAFGERNQDYVYALQVAGDGAPRWQALGASALETTGRDPALSSSFADPRAFGDTVAITRLERRSSSGELLPAGQSRFQLDRFRSGAVGQPLPSVNIPGYAVAYLGTDDAAEYWVSAEPLPDKVGKARLHRLRITAAGAEDERQLELDGDYGGLWPLRVGAETRGVVISNPSDGCGVTQLRALALGGASRGGVLETTSSLDLPSDGWQVSNTDGPRILLRRNPTFALVELDASGTLRLSVVKSPADLSGEQLLGTTVYGGSAAGESARLLLEAP